MLRRKVSPPMKMLARSETTHGLSPSLVLLLSSSSSVASSDLRCYYYQQSTSSIFICRRSHSTLFGRGATENPRQKKTKRADDNDSTRQQQQRTNCDEKQQGKRRGDDYGFAAESKISSSPYQYTTYNPSGEGPIGSGSNKNRETDQSWWDSAMPFVVGGIGCILALGIMIGFGRWYSARIRDEGENIRDMGQGIIRPVHYAARSAEEQRERDEKYSYWSELQREVANRTSVAELISTSKKAGEGENLAGEGETTSSYESSMVTSKIYDEEKAKEEGRIFLRELENEKEKRKNRSLTEIYGGATSVSASSTPNNSSVAVFPSISTRKKDNDSSPTNHLRSRGTVVASTEKEENGELEAAKERAREAVARVRAAATHGTSRS